MSIRELSSPFNDNVAQRVEVRVEVGKKGMSERRRVLHQFLLVIINKDNSLRRVGRKRPNDGLSASTDHLSVLYARVLFDVFHRDLASDR